MTQQEKPGTEEGPTRVLGILRRRLWIIVGCVILVGGLALGFSLLQTKQYSSTASLLFRDPGFDQRLFGSDSTTGTDPNREAATNLDLVSLDAVADLTAVDLPGLEGDDVSGMTTVEAKGASNVISITATDPDPEFAARVANAFAATYVEFRRQADRGQIADAVKLVTEEYEALPPDRQDSDEGQTLQKQIARLQALGALQTGNAEIVQSAEPADSPSEPKTSRNVIVGLFAGLLLGIAVAMLSERLDRRLRSIDDLERAFGLPLLASIPESGALMAGADSTTATADLPATDAEAFQMLRTRLRYFNVDRQIKVVMATSAAPDDGKSTTCWNLAAAAAETGQKAILIEADFRRPTSARRHGLAPSPGLAELLTRQTDLHTAKQRIPVVPSQGGHDQTMDVITSGSPPPSPANLLGSVEMNSLLKVLSEHYDLVVVDAPPILVIADPIPLVGMVDGLIVVSRLNKTTTDQAERLSRQLQNLDAPTLGLVANRVKGDSAYGYGYYYGGGEGKA